MTRKDYRNLAQILHANYVDLKVRPNCADALLPFETMLTTFCEVLKKDNPFFKPDKFIIAVHDGN